MSSIMLNSGVRLRVGLILLAPLVCAVGGNMRETQTAPKIVKFAEPTLRSMTLSTPMPQYPRSSLLASVSGVAVAGVVVGADGHVERVDILQAPDAAIGAALRDALLTWTFRPLPAAPGSNERLRMQGKLVFYFTIVAGKGVITTPAAATRQPGVSAGRGSAPPSVPATTAMGSAPNEIDEAQLKSLTHYKVLDIRDRAAFAADHRPDALNIPLDELPSRAKAELSTAGTVVVDCSQETVARCRLGAQMLAEHGLKPLAILIR